jgi:hypothetical protein
MRWVGKEHRRALLIEKKNWYFLSQSTSNDKKGKAQKKEKKKLTILDSQDHLLEHIPAFVICKDISCLICRQ